MDNDRQSGTIPADPSAGSTQDRRIAFERLRERTDELELIISGLTVFALFSLPGVMTASWLRLLPHIGSDLVGLLSNIIMFASGLSYALAFAFVAHLAVRAYWVGLIGLKSAFPGGIRWDKAPLMGPVARTFFRSHVPDIDSVIDRSDRVASIIFALASLITILTVWIGLLIVFTTSVTLLVKWATGWSELAIQTVLMVLTLSIAGLSLLNWLIDSQIVARRPSLQADGPLRRGLTRNIRLTNAILPQRLILPVQLTLQSNLSARKFSPIFFLCMMMVPVIGGTALVARTQFAPINNYVFFDDDAAEIGMRSAYYEDMRSDEDVSVRVPLIPSDRISGSFLRIFLPHLPMRDNPVIETACPRSEGGKQQIVSPCLASLWQVKLDGRPQVTADFIPIERRDQGMRGLQGYVPLAGFAPGRHDLEIVWNGGGPAEGVQRRREYRIPFWFAPAYELPVE